MYCFMKDKSSGFASNYRYIYLKIFSSVSDKYARSSEYKRVNFLWFECAMYLNVYWKFIGLEPWIQSITILVGYLLYYIVNPLKINHT